LDVLQFVIHHVSQFVGFHYTWYIDESKFARNIDKVYMEVLAREFNG